MTRTEGQCLTSRQKRPKVHPVVPAESIVDLRAHVCEEECFVHGGLGPLCIGGEGLVLSFPQNLSGTEGEYTVPLYPSGLGRGEVWGEAHCNSFNFGNHTVLAVTVIEQHRVSSNMLGHPRGIRHSPLLVVLI